MDKFILLLTLAQTMPAATLVEAAGPIDYVLGLTSTIFAVSFNLSQSVTNVEIWATINGFSTGSYINAFLSSASGPGTVAPASTTLANPTGAFTAWANSAVPEPSLICWRSPPFWV